MRFRVLDWQYFRFSRVVWRLLAHLASWIGSMQVAQWLRIAPVSRHACTQWLAHALNGRRVGGCSCRGELGTPAVRWLVG